MPRAVLRVCTLAAFSLLVAGQAEASVASLRGASAEVDIAAYVAEASDRFGIPADWIWAVIRAESMGRINAVSSAGARGLMQLMPATWALLSARYALGRNPFDPHDNVIAGTAYLRELYDRYGAEGFLAAYNAGPGRYDDWRERGRPLPAETRAYVASVSANVRLAAMAARTTSEAALQPVRMSWTHSRLFALRAEGQSDATGALDGLASPVGAQAPMFIPDRLFAQVSASGSP